MLIATSPRRSSDQEKKSSEEPYPVDVDCNSSKCKYGISSGKSGDMAFEEHSRQIKPESAYKYMTGRIKTKEQKEPFDNHQTMNVQSSVYYNSVKSTTMQNDMQHHKNQATESQGEDFIYYVQHAEAPSEELDTSLETSSRTDEFCNFLQTATVESDEANHRTLNAPLEVPHHSVHMATVESELGNTLQSPNAKLKHQTNSLKIPTCKSDKLCHTVKPLQLDELLESTHIANVQKEETFTSSQSVAVQSQENLTTSLVSSSQSVNVESEKNVTALPVMSSQSVTVQSEENFTSSMVTYSQPEIVQSEEPLTSLKSLIVQPQKLVTSLQSLIVHSNEPFISSQSLIAQSNEPVTFPKSATARSDKLCTSSNAAAIHSKELFKSSHAAAVQSRGLLTSSETETFQSNELLTSSRAAAVQPKDLCTSSETAAVQSNEIKESLTSVHKTTIQSEDSMKTLKTVPSEELCRKIQMLNPVLVNACDELKTKKSRWPYISEQTSTDYQEEVNRPSLTSTAQREEFDDLLNTAPLKSLNLFTLKTAPQVQQEDHNSQEEFSLNDLCLTRQSVSNHSDGLNQSMQDAVVPEKCCLSKSIIGKMDETGNAGQKVSSIFAEPCMKLASTVQSEAIYGSFDSQWSDRVTANKVAVEGDLNS